MNRILILLALLMLFKNGSAQVKIGTAPTLLERSALLELNGNKQGLLLPRLIDTGLINTLVPPDGMLIYLQSGNTGRGLYLRKSGFWQRITTDSVLSASLNSWSLTGNTGLTGSEKLGPIAAVPLHIITGNTDRILIDGTGSTTITGNTILSGSLTLNPSATATDINALLLNGSNTVVKRNLNTVAFNGAIQSLDGLTAATQTFGTTNTTNTAIGFSNSGTIHNLNIPDADAVTRGVVTTTAQTIAGNKTFTGTLTLNTSGATGVSGLTFSKLNSTTAETSGAKAIGVDASGNIVRTATPVTYYTTGGTANVTKVWVGKLTNTAGTGTLTFDISSAGFTNVLDIQATAQRNGASSIQLPFATITTATITTVVVKLTKGAVMVLLGDSMVAETDATASVYLKVEGN